jgi:transaldolase
MHENLYKLADFGQSVWFDDINRDVINSGTLDELIDEYNVTGGTSNPTIFEKAFSGSDAYEEQFRQLATDITTPEGIQDMLAITDVQIAADRMRPAFDRTDGGDGYVSLEVAPGYANDTERTISETRRLWAALERPNVMIKIPGTPAGMPAIEACLAEGINVNITLLFSVESYRQVTEAHLRALEKRVAAGQPIDRIASVASFFVSRVDTLADERLTALAEAGPSPERKAEILALRGRLGVANAKLAYQVFLEVTTGERWQKLARAGARPQRCLWASTSTKNPAYSDVLYIDELIGPQTVNTMPEDTIHAFADHGHLRETLTTGIEDARLLMARLREAGLDVDDVTRDLLAEGVEKFIKSYDDAIRAIRERSQRVGSRA